MSGENEGREADIRTDYRAQFTLDGPEGRQIEVTVVAPTEAMALGVAQQATLGLAAGTPPPPSRPRVHDFLAALGEGLGRVMVQSGVFMHVYDRPDGEPDAEYEDEEPHTPEPAEAGVS